MHDSRNNHIKVAYLGDEVCIYTEVVLGHLLARVDR